MTHDRHEAPYLSCSLWCRVVKSCLGSRTALPVKLPTIMKMLAKEFTVVFWARARSVRPDRSCKRLLQGLDTGTQQGSAFQPTGEEKLQVHKEDVREGGHNTKSRGSHAACPVSIPDALSLQAA
jgi:hypothetical protein